MEIGSFIEMQFPQGKEFYSGDLIGEMPVARLNSGKAALWHAFRVSGCESIWLPYYQCDSVRAFFRRKSVEPLFYRIDRDFMPLDLHPDKDDAVLLVNYYGMMSSARMQKLASRYEHVIIDNCQAFFAAPVEHALNVYSCRKFIGVPDGAYVIGPDSEKHMDEYPRCFSSDTSLFLLQRIEYGCEGKAYSSRTENESRIESEDVMLMSSLTHRILDGTDYQNIIRKRQVNFRYAAELFAGMNRIDPLRFIDNDSVPMVYPLVVEDDTLLDRLQNVKHFQGHWWSYLCDEMPKNSAEYWLSRYMIPITIDQRYGFTELDFVFDAITVSRFTYKKQGAI